MKHTISVTVEDRPGALTRITTMFARRGFNIDSLAVGPTERPGVSCITLRVDCAQHTLEQILIHCLRNLHTKTKCDDLILSGGIPATPVNHAGLSIRSMNRKAKASSSAAD